jgi:hypothetical protein
MGPFPAIGVGPLSAANYSTSARGRQRRDWKHDDMGHTGLVAYGTFGPEAR